MIHRLTVLIINTGLITAIATLLTIVFVRLISSLSRLMLRLMRKSQLGVQPATFTYAFFNFLVSPLYANSVMANLNSREYIRGRRDAGTAGSLEMNAWNINDTTSVRSSMYGSGCVLIVASGVSAPDLIYPSWIR
jgi:hypothetical protein